MGFDPTKVNLGPILGDIKETVDRYLPNSGSDVEILLTSSSLIQTSTTTLKNVVYISPLASEMGVNDFCHFLSSRVSFFESALICVASLVHHIFFLTFYTALAVLTMGLSSNINHCFKKHWFNVALSTTCIGINAIGVFVPTLGAYANMGLLYFCYKLITWDYEKDLDYFEKPLVKEIQKVFARQKDNIKLFLRAHVRSNDHYFRLVDPAIKSLDHQLTKANSMDDVFGALTYIFNNFPNIEPQKEIKTPHKINKNV